MEKQVTHEQMNALTALANTNIEVSKAKELLFKMKENENEYLVLREKKAIAHIQKIIDDSQNILSKARDNYYETTQFYNTVSSFSSSLNESYLIFQEMLRDFEEKNTLWENSMKEREEKVKEFIKNIDEDRIRISNDKKGIESQKKLLDEEKIRINDMRGTVEREIIRLKQKNND